MNNKDKKIINDKFIKLVESIPNSYMYLEDRHDIINASSTIEIELMTIRKFSKDFKEGNISLEELKKGIISVVSHETDEMIVVDENRNEISDEEKTLQNFLAINSFDENELKEFVKKLYKIISTARICIIHKLKPDAQVFIANNEYSSDLNVFN